MYARVISFQARPGVQPDEARRLYKEVAVELAQQEGYLGSSFMLDEQSHRVIFVTWWRDPDCAARGGQRILPLILEREHDLMAGPPVIAGYDVFEQTFQLPGS